MFLLLFDKADSGQKGCSESTSLLFDISEHPLVSRNFSIVFRKFLLKNFEPDRFKFKLLPPGCLTLTLLYCLLYQSLVAKDVL